MRDLAFAVDVTDSTMLGGSTLAELWEGSASAESTGPSEIAEALWSRARVMGASTALERRAFGKADDVYAAGLLVLYLCFVPFANPGDIDGAQLQRLVESTFRLDMEAFR